MRKDYFVMSSDTLSELTCYRIKTEMVLLVSIPHLVTTRNILVVEQIGLVTRFSKGEST